MSLSIDPKEELFFTGPFNAVSITHLTLSNNTTEKLAYKIKTTAPKRYCVKPNSGYLEARASAKVQVMLQPLLVGQTDDRAKHKFMVQWATVAANFNDDVEGFWKDKTNGADFQDAKLRCGFEDELVTAPKKATKDGTESTSEHSSYSPTGGDSNKGAAQGLIQKNPTPASPSKTDSLNTAPIRPKTDPSAKSVEDPASELERLRKENPASQAAEKNQLTNRRTVESNVVGNPVLRQSSIKNEIILFGMKLNEQMVLAFFVISLLVGLLMGYIIFPGKD